MRRNTAPQHKNKFLVKANCCSKFKEFTVIYFAPNLMFKANNLEKKKVAYQGKFHNNNNK